MEHLAIISHKSFRADGLNKSRSPSSPYGPAPQGTQLITLVYPVYFESAGKEEEKVNNKIIIYNLF